MQRGQGAKGIFRCDSSLRAYRVSPCVFHRRFSIIQTLLLFQVIIYCLDFPCVNMCMAKYIPNLLTRLTNHSMGLICFWFYVLITSQNTLRRKIHNGHLSNGQKFSQIPGMLVRLRQIKKLMQGSQSV